MSLTYAIADLHGRFDLLTAAFDAIVKHAAERSFKIITLGDYVDRGPQSRQIIDHLMAAQEMGVSLICLKGNHEDMMVETLRKPLHPNWWIDNGGGRTLISYGHERSCNYTPPTLWKWVILAMQNALQGAMVLALTGTDGCGALFPDSQKRNREWLQSPTPVRPRRAMADFNTLLVWIQEAELEGPVPLLSEEDRTNLKRLRMKAKGK